MPTGRRKVLEATHVDSFRRDGFVVLEGALDPSRLAALRDEIADAARLSSPEVLREADGAVRTVFSLHDPSARTGRPATAALARSPELLSAVRALLGRRDIYIFHSKANLKPALEGTPFLWHQDYGYWQHDAVPGPHLVTVAVLLDRADPLSGCLNFKPASQRLGLLPHETVRVGGFTHFTVQRDVLRARLREGPPPVAVEAGAGAILFFDSLVCHASGHNLSPEDRRILYVTYNRCDNAPVRYDTGRPEFVSARDTRPLA